MPFKRDWHSIWARSQVPPSLGHSRSYFLKAWSCSGQTVICNVNMMYSLELVHWQWLCGLTQCLSEFIHPKRLFATIVMAPKINSSTFHRLQSMSDYSKHILAAERYSCIRYCILRCCCKMYELFSCLQWTDAVKQVQIQRTKWMF